MSSTEQSAGQIVIGASRARRRRSTQAQADARLGIALVAPAVITIILVAFYPLGRSIWDSMHKISLRFENQPRPFIGLRNYKDVLQDSRWHNALWVTLRVVVFS